MLEWTMAHPWLTFFLILFALLVVDSIVGSICKAIIAQKEERKHEPEPPKEECE